MGRIRHRLKNEFRRGLCLALVALLLLLGQSHAQSQAYGQAQTPPGLPAPQLPPQTQSSPDAIVPGVVLVRLVEGTGRSRDAAQRLGVAEETLAPLSIAGQPELYRLTVADGDEISSAASLAAHPDVLYAEPDYLFHLTETTPNDSLYERLQWNLPHIGANTGWDRTTGSASVVIGIVDTGVDLGHPDLSNKIVGGIDTVNDDFVAGDDQGHGTHVASIAAAETNNDRGVAGVDWNARIMPVKVLNAAGSGSGSQLAAGITWAADNGADILNMSLVGGNQSTIVGNAIQYAYEKGVLLIAAAGNSYTTGNPVSYPAAYEHVLGVAAVDDQDGHASYSNSGSYVDVAAPGGDPSSASDDNNRHWIAGAYWRGAGFSYAWLSGTSQAAPHVAGLASLLLSVNPLLTADELAEIITSSAVDVQAPGRDPFSGYGRIDIPAALALVTAPAIPGVTLDLQLDQPHTELAGVVAVGAEVTFTMRITNTGTTALTVVPLQDVYDATYLRFVRANPAPDNMAAGNLQWFNLIGDGTLPTGSTLTVTATFRTYAATDDEPNQQTSNVATVAHVEDEFGHQPPPQTDTELLRVARSAVAVETTILSPEPSGVGVGADITFGIRVENVGAVPLGRVPIYDLYEADALQYLHTNITPPRITISGVNGELFWSDITGEFGTLNPGQVVEFTATFRMIAPRTTTNLVQTGTVLDINGNPVPPAQGLGHVEVIPAATPIYRLFAPHIGSPFSPAPIEQPCPVPGCPINGLVYPNGMTIHRGLSRLFINSRDTNQLIVVDALTLLPIAKAGTGAEPWDVVINEKTNRVYVSNFADGTVWVYDADDLTLLAQIHVGGNPGVMDILPDLDTVAVAVHQLNGVALIRGLSLQAIVGSGGAGTFGVAADPLSQDFTIINRDAGTGRVLYRLNNSWQAKGAEITFGKKGDRLVPFEAEFNPLNQKLYVTYMQANGLWYVDIFHKESSLVLTKRATVPVGNSGSDRNGDVGGAGLAINTATGNLFVANTFDNTVSVVSGATDQVVATIPTGADPFRVMANPATNRVYISLRKGNRIHKLIDTH